MNSGGASNAVAEIAQRLGHGIVAAAAFTAREIEDGSGTSRLLAFGDALQPGSAASSTAPQPAWAAPAG